MPVGPNGLTPPSDRDAEEAVLGSILLDGAALGRVPHLLPGEFYIEAHQTILRAARELFRRGEPIDNVTVGAELDRMKQLLAVGGREKLAQLQEVVPFSGHIEHYAAIVQAKAAKRRAIKFGQDVIAKGFDEGVSAEDATAFAQRGAMDLAESSVHAEPVVVGSMLDDFIALLEELRESGAPPGISSGFASLDRVIGGLKPQDLIVIAGRASMGKTALAVNVGLRVAKAGKSVAMFSLEMSKEQVVGRLVAQEARVAAQRLANPSLLGDQEYGRVMSVMDSLHKAKFWIDDQSASDEVVIAAKARSLAMKPDGLDLIIIDYLQLMQSSRDFRDNRVQEVGHLTRSLKRLARELRIPIIALSQVSRAPDSREDKRPRLSDLRESGDIEQDCDIAIGVFRPHYYDDKADVHAAEAIVMKNRNGDTATVNLRFSKEQTRFDDITYREEEAPRPVALYGGLD